MAMDDELSHLLRRLMKVPPGRRLDRWAPRVAEFYGMMRDDPRLPPEEFLTLYPGSEAHYEVVLLFAHALDLNRDDAPAGTARLLGKKLANDHYHILYRLGKGGMGEVYAARPANTIDDVVALKTIYTRRPGGAERDRGQVDELRRRIVKEASYLKRVTNHDNVVQFIHAGYDPEPINLIYIVTNLIEGRSLDELVDGRFPDRLPPGEVLWLIREACRGLIAIHDAPESVTGAHGVGGGKLLHRDIKPSNILLDSGGRVKLVDFGLAGTAGPTSLAWRTEDFCAPEQDLGGALAGGLQRLDERVDVYSLGKTFFSLLCGVRNPPRELPSAGDPIWAGVPASYPPVILKATERDRENRFADAKQFLAALEGLGTVSEPQEKQSWNRVRQLLACEDREVNAWVGRDLARARTSVPQGNRLKWTNAALALGAVSLAGWGLSYLHARATKLTPSSATRPSSQPPLSYPPSTTKLRGSLDVTLWHPGDPRRQRLSLRDAGALPLRRGDLVRVSARVSRPAYVYVIWIDSYGKPQPIHPWIPGSWELPASGERPVAAVDLPEATNDSVQGWGLKGDSGMETLLLLASESPQASSISSNFKDRLADLPRPAIQNDRASVWFDGSGPIKPESDEDPDRGPIFFDVRKVDDPLLESQARIRKAFGHPFVLLKAVSFANVAR